MATTYARMLADHAEIEAAAARLVDWMSADVEKAAGEAHARLCVLAALVEEHIVNEEVVVGVVSERGPDGPWAERWQVGLAAFERLRSDWLAFLDRWSLVAIQADYLEFRLAARAMLRRIRDRLAWETDEFYAVALQAGAIFLRA